MKIIVLISTIIMSSLAFADQEIKGNLTLIAKTDSFVGKDIRVELEKNGLVVDTTYSSLNGNFYLHTKELGEYLLKILDHGKAIYTKIVQVDEQVEKLEPIEIKLENDGAS